MKNYKDRYNLKKKEIPKEGPMSNVFNSYFQGK